MHVLRCRTCQTDNPMVAQFCRDCGNSLTSAQLSKVAFAATSEAHRQVYLLYEQQCGHCGQKTLGDGEYCMRCGQQLALAQPATPPPSVTCPHCRAETPSDSVYCIECGGRLGPPSTASTSSGAPTTRLKAD